MPTIELNSFFPQTESLYHTVHNIGKEKHEQKKTLLRRGYGRTYAGAAPLIYNSYL